MKNFSLEEMENMFEIGRTLEVKIRVGELDDDIDSKELFSFALKCATEFEYEYPDSDDYYADLDKFVEHKIKEELK